MSSALILPDADDVFLGKDVPEGAVRLSQPPMERLDALHSLLRFTREATQDQAMAMLEDRMIYKLQYLIYEYDDTFAGLDLDDLSTLEHSSDFDPNRLDWDHVAYFVLVVSIYESAIRWFSDAILRETDPPAHSAIGYAARHPDPDPRAVGRFLLETFWPKMYELRFLIIDPTFRRTMDIVIDFPHVVADLISGSWQLIYTLPWSEHSRDGVMCFAQLCLFFYIRHPSSIGHSTTLTVLMKMLSCEEQVDEDVWAKLCDLAIGDVVSTAAIGRALRYDFKQDSYHTLEVNRVRGLYMKIFCGDKLPPRLWGSYKFRRDLYRCYLSACMREFCCHTMEDDLKARVLHELIFVNWMGLNTLRKDGNRVVLEEEDVHMSLAVFAESFVIALDLQDQRRLIETLAYTFELASQYMITLRILRRRHQQPDVSPRLNAMRRISPRYFAPLQRTLDNHRETVLSLPSPASTVGSVLRNVGRIMPAASDAIEDWAPPPLEGCAFKECLCSVFAPAHRLHVCKGCWSVAYCGPKCQESDWKAGHGRTCLGARKSRA